MDNAMVASTGADRNSSQPNALNAKVTLCARVKAVMVQNSRRLKPTRNSRPITKN